LAIDSKGNAGAADSTGGVQLKLPGRIGDSAILGGGIYADSSSAAAATGNGEQAIRLAITRTACIMMENKSASTAAIQAVRLATRLFGRGTGLITLKRDGSYGVAHNTPNLCWAMKSENEEKSAMIGIRVSTR
jgi:beta-aspartyl-peptidase (threonine type)